MVTVKEVKTKKQLKTFVEFPTRFYKDCEQYIPALYGDDISDWDKSKNPAFEYCDAKCFLAYRDGNVVGRIAAIYNRKSNEKWKNNRMRFSQVDFIDDPEVSDALFGAVEAYARELGCDEIHGPLGFTDLDREGMLVEGFDRRSMFVTYYNHPYYIDHMARLGYVKDIDWVENFLRIPDDEKTLSLLHRLAERTLARSGLRVVRLKRRRDYKPYVRKVFRLLNIAYAELYGTVDLSEKQINKYADKFIPLVDPDFVCFLADKNDELAAFAVSAPSLADAFKKCDGKLFPFGFVGILRAMKVNDTLDMFLIAVHPDYQSTGVNAILLDHVLQGCRKMGIKYAETGPMLETNEKIRAQWRTFDPEQHKRRRCFIKNLK